MPAAMNKRKADILPNHELSDIDRAYMAINYPRDLSSVLKALETIDLDSKTTLAIIKAHVEHDTLEMRRLLATSGLFLSPPNHFHKLLSTLFLTSRNILAGFRNGVF
jgi:hypothetical protein